jgi:hypothetical protein
MRCALGLVVVSAACGSSHLLQPYPVQPEAVRKACAMELSCLSPAPITSGGSCVSQFEQGMADGFGILFGPSAADLARYVNCASSAGDCTTALNCASKNHGPAWCMAHPNPTCDGDTLVNCVGGWGLELNDCTQLNLHCRSANGFATCSDGTTCDGTVTDQCMGNRYVTCDSQTHLGASFDCGQFIPGGVCRHIVNGTSSETGCFGPGSATCTATETMASCDGAAIVSCGYGTTVRVDCSQFQSHCLADNSNGSSSFSCAPDATDCTATSPDSCVGNAIQMCVNGKWEQTACSSFGLSSCATTNSGGVKCS